MPPSLTDDEIAAIMTAAQPLARTSRDAFVQAVVADLAMVPERGPGALHRVIRVRQREHFDPPADGGLAHAPKYDRR
jgi:hypothetical protein